MEWYRVLGPVEVLADGRPVAIGGPKPRSLLVLLLLNAGRVVPSGQRRSQRSRPG